MFLYNPNYDRNKAYNDRKYNEPELLKPTPVDGLIDAFGDAMESFLAARKALNREKKDVPGYTAQYDPEDYYAQEQENYNRALERLYKAMRAS